MDSQIEVTSMFSGFIGKTNKMHMVDYAGYLREIWHKHKPDFLFLSETKQDFPFVQGFQDHFGYDRLVTVDPIGASGGLALFYNNELQVNILYTSNMMIDVEAVALGKKDFYDFWGSGAKTERTSVGTYGLVRSEPWFIIGGLNEITGNHEKDGGALRSAGYFLPFNNMIRNTCLLEFPARGNQMSWQGRRNKIMVRCHLDRALANEDCHALFPCSYTEYLEMVGSDHRPIVAFLENKVPRRRGQFQFDKRWIRQEGLLESIKRGWIDRQERISELQRDLDKVQTYDNRTQQEIMEVSRKLQEAYKDEEDYWQQKSGNMWNKAGNLNTKFYHALTKQRRARNRIVDLYDSEGNWIAEEQGIQKVAVEFFDNLFQSTELTNFEQFLEDIPSTITPQMNQRLLRLATEEKVRQALFMMHPEKAP
ncbi:hypothetical protein N665_0641s0010 [Sinapis alba]|nr:hypothetical protein N665_0641s0010 [Sinapis alba]